MKGILSESKRSYVLLHLQHHLHVSAEISSRFVFTENLTTINHHGKIIFPLSGETFNIERIRYINNLPVLFPFQDSSELYKIDENQNLLFAHDFLKSIFYLLSGYQEYDNQNSKDQLGRYSYEDSIQHKLNIIQLPVVNLYFNIITEAIGKFSKLHGIDFETRKLFNHFGFLLTHDIDYVDCYTANYFIYKLKEVAGLKKSRLSAISNLKLAVRGFLKYTGILKNDNPFWNFNYLLQLEKAQQFKSVFYFLDQGIKNSDAAYSFEEPRIRSLFKQLEQNGCEIGLHGPVQSVTDPSKMRSSFNKLSKASETEIVGNRQHRLLWRHPQTAIIQAETGLKYDTTLGFAAHQGFRNSYCYPFKLYDFDNDKMIDIWEFPMTVMDVTLFGYRNYTPAKALEECTALITEIKKHGGIFTLIWHNSFFDENTYPGVTKFYENLLSKIKELEAESILGKDLVTRIGDIK